MKVNPLHDRVLVLRVESDEKTAEGIIIPDTAKEKPLEGKVVAVGEGRYDKDGRRVPIDLKAGDKVLFARYGGMEIRIDGVEHLMMKEEEILGVID
jgi:chaperonin GroES